MQVFEALALEAERLRGRVGVEDRRRRHVAKLEADALSVLQVDGWKKDHASASLPPLSTARTETERMARGGNLAAPK